MKQASFSAGYAASLFLAAPLLAAGPGKVSTPDNSGGGADPWSSLAIAAVVVALGALLVLRRRHGPDGAEAVVAAGGIDNGPVSDGHVAPTVHDRPWLDLAMRPIRAGTSADEALVEIELTVANSGTVPAEDVRVSTFMLTDAHASEMRRMLVDAPADAAIDPVTIPPGEGTRIDATLAALKADLGADGSFTPVVVADARYRLSDGREGRTSAAFLIGISGADGGSLIPIDLGGCAMRDDVVARPHGAPERA